MRRSKNSIKITAAHIDALNAAKEETGCGAAMFLRWVDDAPKGLNSTTIYNWMIGKADTANKELLDFVLENWPKMPKRVEVTESLVAKLNAEQERTGIGATRLLKTMDAVPSGLKAITVSTWKSMRADKAREDHIEAVLKAYASIK